MGRVPWELCSAHPVRMYKTWWSCYYGCVKVVLFKEDAICYEPSMECVLQQTGGGQQFTREKQVDLYIRKQTRALSWLPRTVKKRPSCNGVGGHRGAPAHPAQGLWGCALVCSLRSGWGVTRRGEESQDTCLSKVGIRYDQVSESVGR